MVATMLTAHAESVPMNEARQKAQAFFSSNGVQIASEVYRAPRKGQFATTSDEAAAYYVFNAADEAGFVVISGDDRTDAVLAFADHGSFDINRIPAPVRAMLDSYAAQIGHLNETDEAAAQLMLRAPRRVQTHLDVAPLIQTHWGQGAATAVGHPFNMMCPVSGADYCLTGCVATAMAQVLKYHEYPKDSTIVIPSYFSNLTIGTLPALPRVLLDWANMKDSYSGGETDSTAQAVATIMRYCGQSVKANYGTGGTSAYDSNIPSALRNCFGYDAGIRYVKRESYTIADWDELIYGELSQGRPVIYNGQSSGGGHSFICDGYRVKSGVGYYHINWGWEGLADGYYKLALADPEDKGAGGGTSVDGFSASQSAVIGIRPDQGGTLDDAAPMMWGTEATVEGTQVKIKFQNLGTASFNGKLGLAVIDEYNNIQKVISQYTIPNFPANANTYSQSTFELKTLANGSYRLAPISQENGESSWRVCGLKGLFIEVVMKSRQIDSYVIHPEIKIEIVGRSMTGHRLTFERQEIELRLHNTGDEFNGVLYLCGKLPDSNPVLYAQSGLALEVDASETVKFGFTPQTEGTYTLMLCADSKMKNVLSQTEVQIDAAPTSRAQLSLVEDYLELADSVTYSVTLTNNGSDPYLRPVTFRLYQSPQLSGTYPMIEQKTVSFDLPVGETKTYECVFKGLPKAFYAIEACYAPYFAYSNTQRVQLTRFSYEPYTLTISEERRSATLILPFTATRPQGVSIYTLEFDTENQLLARHEWTNTTVPAYTPLLVVAQPGDYTFVSTIPMAMSTIPSAPTTVGVATGVYETTEVPVGRYTLTGLDEEGDPVFKKVEETEYEIPANRVYLTLPDAATETVKTVHSAIGDIAADESLTRGDLPVYDLSGRQLTTTRALREGKAALSSGIYLINGRKLWMK